MSICPRDVRVYLYMERGSEIQSQVVNATCELMDSSTCDRVTQDAYLYQK